MGNEASLEGGEQPGEPGSSSSIHAGSASAPAGSEQLPKAGIGSAAAEGGGAAGASRLAVSPNKTDPFPGLKPAGQPGYGIDSRVGGAGGGRTEPYRVSPREPTTPQGPGMHASRRSLQVDVSSRSGRSPSVSPDRGSAPTSPYSVPQIAPMPSSKLCPVCNTTDLTTFADPPNCNTCTQCRTLVCNQCGFNPNPHLTEVQEWLCLNCQMQRALGMDMTTPRSKSHQQIHFPSHQPKPELVPQVQQRPQSQPLPLALPGPQRQMGPTPASQLAPLGGYAHASSKNDFHTATSVRQGMGSAPVMAKAPSQPDLSRSSPMHQPHPSRQSQIRSAGSSPSRQPAPPPEQDGLTGKLFGFGASLLNQASTLMSVDPTQSASPQPSPARGGHKVVFSDANKSQVPTSAPLSAAAKPFPQGSHVPLPHESPQKMQQQAQQSPQKIPVQQPPTMQMTQRQLQQQQQSPQKVLQPAQHLHQSPQKYPPSLQEQQLLGQKTQQQSPQRSPHSSQQQQSSQKFPHPSQQQPPAQKSQPLQQQQQSPQKLPQQQQLPQTQKTPQQQLQQQSPQKLPQQKAQPATTTPQQSPQKKPQQPLQQQTPQKRQPLVAEPEKPKVSCPLCKTELNFGSMEPPNYNKCTQCRMEVCNLCGFNPTPHLVEKKEWLCLNCQTQRLMLGSLGDMPAPLPQPSPKHQPMGSPRHHPPASETQVHPPSHQRGANQQQAKLPSMSGSSPVPPTTKPPPETQLDKGSLYSTTEGLKQPKTTEKEKIIKSEKELTTQAPIKEVKAGQKKAITEQATAPAVVKDIKKTGERQKSRHYDETSKSSNQDLSRSPQSLSDTGYSSDGISSSQSEITGLIQEEEIKLSERGISEHSPPSPSEITKLESSMRPLLEAKSLSDQEQKRGRGRHHRDSRDHDDKKQRPRSLSITPEAYDSDEELEDILEEDEDPGDWEDQDDLGECPIESSDDFSSKLRHDYVEDSSESGFSPLSGRSRKTEKEMTDEEFMRRQILEMSADEDINDDEDEEYTYQKPKKMHKHISDSGKRRLSHHSSSYDEDSKGIDDGYQGTEEDADEDLMSSQGGLRRFKTIELNNTSSYSRDIELSNENDLSLDREPELEMESLTGSPEERSRGEYSSTLPATTPSYTSGTSPTSVSSMEEDSDSSPSRRQRLEEAKQQRKARHRSHGPLLPTIEDSSEEDELREEEELLREQEKMREVEQQRIRSTARKTKRDKEELRAQRRRERSKTPPSNLSPIEDASPTEELRQAAEMEELHRSSCSEYSPSIDSEAEGFEIIASKLYKSGSEYNLPTFMSLYSPTEKPITSASSSTSKPLKSAEEVYEEMMRKAEMLQKQQKQQTQQIRQGQQNLYQQQELCHEQQHQEYNEYDYDNNGQMDYENINLETENIYEEIRQTSQNITSSTHELQQKVQQMESSFTDKQLLDTGSAFAKLLEQNNALLTPGTSPTQLSAPVSFASSTFDTSGTGSRGIPDVRVTQHFTKEGQKDKTMSHTGKHGTAPTTASCVPPYGAYGRDTVNISSAIIGQGTTTTPSAAYGRLSSASNVSSKITELTQAYNQKEITGKRVTESRGIQVRDGKQTTSSEIGNESLPSKVYSYFRGSSPPLSPSDSPTQSPTRSPSRKGTTEFSTQTFSNAVSVAHTCSSATSPVIAQGTQTPHKISPRLLRQHSSQDSPFIVITLSSEPTSPSKPVTVNSSTSPLSSPTRATCQIFHTFTSTTTSPTFPQHQHHSPQHTLYKTKSVEKVNVGTSMVTTSYGCGSLSMENISLCRISTVPGTSRVEQGQMLPCTSVVDLRTLTKSGPVIMSEQGMDLTSLAAETCKFSLGVDGSPSRTSTAVPPLIVNLNTQEHQHVATSIATTVSVTVAASMFMSQPKQPVIYGDPLQNRVDLGHSMAAAVCLTQSKPLVDTSITKIDAKLEDLSIAQQKLLKQQQKLQEQQQQLEQQLQQHHQQQQQLQQQQAASFARFNLANQVPPLLKKDLLVSQTSTTKAVVSAIPRASPLPDQAASSAVSPNLPHDMYGATVLELKNKSNAINLSTVKPQVMMVQLEPSSQGMPLSQLIKTEDIADAMDLTGQIKSESQIACCDVVYRLPFTGSCPTGPFSQKQKVIEKTQITEPQNEQPPSVSTFYGSRSQESTHVGSQYESQFASTGRLQPSISDSNLADTGNQNYQPKIDPVLQGSVDTAMDLSTMKRGYDGGYLGMGMQYGSYTDLRHQGDVKGQSLPIRRYGSMSNINTDFGFSQRDVTTFQESNLAHYSATTAREINRMCAALNSMDQFGARYSSNPELMQYTSTRVVGLSGLVSVRGNLMYSPEGRQIIQGQAYATLANARQLNLRASYPSAIRAADGMIYSTINTPIASTLPITTQPASVLQPMIRGVYRPYPATIMTAVPLANVTRVPVVTPRMPLSSQRPYRYPPPNHFSTSPAPISIPATNISQDSPVYLGKPLATSSAPSTVVAAAPAQPANRLGGQNVYTVGSHTTSVPPLSVQVASTSQQKLYPIQMLQSQPLHLQTQPQTLSQIQQPMQLQSQHPAMPVQAQSHIQQAQHQTLSKMPPQAQTQLHTHPLSMTHVAATPAAIAVTGSSNSEKDKEEERLRRQQEQLLHIERECVELEKLRQMRLQEELERERLELQRNREKEQMIVQREIQELQSIKQQVLQQQQTERESQLVLQREQLAQQKQQLDQIQSLQQQLQQQLEEQKRQKTAAAAAAAAVVSATTATTAHVAIQEEPGTQPISYICDQTGRVIQQDMQAELQRGPNGQLWQRGAEGQVLPTMLPSRPLQSSASEISLRHNEELLESRAMRKRNSMPRLRDGLEGEEHQHMSKRIADSSVQTDDEDGDEKFLVSRRRRIRRSVDCSVQTDDEDKAEWEQPVRRRRSRFSKHSDDSKADSSKVSSSSIAIQTIRDCSCQTEPEQLRRTSPAIHITTPDPRVEIVHYISAPERTQKGESLACQTEPEAQAQGVVVPQLNVPTTISAYSANIQFVGSASGEPLSPRQQGVAKFERRKPDPLEIGYQSHHLHNESFSSLVRQAPKSPQVLYSPVSPLSPHRLLETSLSSSERLNRAHVTPQKHFTTESPQRQQTIPRPIKSVHRSLSDPKPLSPTSEDPARARLSLYQQHALQSQLSSLQQSSLMRKVKRTLPSPPPEESHLPIVTPALSQMYVSTLPLKSGSKPELATKASLLKDITHELKVVEQESTKLRKQQAELEEEEKEIDAKLRYLELGITQRKETLLKERERRELAYIRCMGDTRDYMSDSELNNIRIMANTFESNGILSRPSTAPLNQFTPELNTAPYPPTSSFVSYQYPQSQPTPQTTPTYQQTGFQPPQYPTVTQALPQSSTLPPLHPPPSYQAQGAFPPPSQPCYQSDLGIQPCLPGFQPLAGPPYPTQTLPYPTQSTFPTAQSIPFQPQAEILTVHQRPRQTSLADLEQKIPTNYEVISNPTVVVTTVAQDSTYSSTTIANTYGQYTTTVASTYGQYSTSITNTYGQYTTSLTSSYGQYSTSVANTYGQYKPPDSILSERIHSADSPTSVYTSEGLYSNLEQNVPRNYVMIDDINELTKDNMGTSGDMHKMDSHGHPTTGRYGSEGISARVGSYGRTEEESEEDLYDHHSRGKSTSSYHPRGSDSHGRVGSSSSIGGGSSYYYDDYKHSTRSSTGIGVQKHSSKSLAPAVVSTKRSKHRKQGIEQKISKFSPIEEAKDVESDLASYAISTTTGGSCTVMSRAKKLQDEITYGLKKNVYDHQKYYGMSSREILEAEDDRMYSSGRSRSTGYGMDKISTRDSGNHRSKSYERDVIERSQRGSHSRGRPSMRSQNSEEESPLSPLGKPMGAGRGSVGPEPTDSRNQYGSSHSLPDVQDHMKDLPRSHVYKPDDSYIIDDMHCAVSDSEAYHLGQEETDWFEKPREARADRSRHYSSGSHSSQRRNHVKHTYHDYDEPPEEDLWPQEDYGHSRHSSSRDHRHHSSTSGRHSSSSRPTSEDPRSSRSSKGHVKDPSIRHDSRQMSSSSGKRSDSRSSGVYHSSDYSRDSSGHHHTGQRSQKPPSSSSHHQQTSRKQQDLQSHPPSSRQQGSSQQQRSTVGPSSARLSASQQPQDNLQPQVQQSRNQQQQQQQQTAARPPQQPSGTAQQQPAQATQLQAKPGQTQARQPQAGAQPATAAKTDTPPASAVGAKPAAAQPAKTPQPPLTGIGSKAAPRLGGIGSAAAGQPAGDGESVFSKILPGGAAEQAGKLGEAVSAFGKKFTSFW